MQNMQKGVTVLQELAKKTVSRTCMKVVHLLVSKKILQSILSVILHVSDFSLLIAVCGGG